MAGNDLTAADWAAMLQRAAQAGPGAAGDAIPGTVSDAEAGYYKVYLGSRPTPSRGPALHADSLNGPAPKGRGPLMHYDPADAPWDDLRSAKQGDIIASIDDAMVRIYNETTQKKFIELLRREGVVADGDLSWDVVEGWWQKAVEGAAMMYTHGGKKITPEQWIEIYAGKNGIFGTGDGSQTLTSTQTSRVEIDDLDARAVAEDAYAALLGRRPNKREMSGLRAALQAYADAHPSISKSTMTEDASGNRTTSTTTSGGLSGQGMTLIGEDQVRAEPGYAEYQAATTYFNALQQALGATADVG